MAGRWDDARGGEDDVVGGRVIDRRLGDVSLRVRRCSLHRARVQQGAHPRLHAVQLRYLEGFPMGFWSASVGEGRGSHEIRTPSVRTVCGWNPDVSGRLVDAGGVQGKQVAALRLLLGASGPGKGGLEHAGGADEPVAATPLHAGLVSHRGGINGRTMAMGADHQIVGLGRLIPEQLRPL